MRHKMLSSLLFAWFVGVPVLAQNQTTPTPNTSTPDTSTPLRSPKDNDNTRRVTVTGCLEKGAQPGTFVLTKVPDLLTDSVAVAAGSPVPTVTYQLSGGQNLATHVGHRMEVTGKTSLKPKTPVKVTDTERKEPAVGGGTAQVREAVAITLRPLAVDSTRMISTDCLGK